MDSKTNNIFKAILGVIIFLLSYIKCMYYSIVQNITGRHVYKWQKYVADFKKKYDSSAQSNAHLLLISFVLTIIIFSIYFYNN